jgi:hypothetical protein
MNEEIAVTSILGNEALTSSLDDERASKLIKWASKLVKVIAQKNDGQVDEFYLDLVREMLKQVNRFYSTPDEEGLARTEALMKVGGCITFFSEYFDEYAELHSFMGVTRDSFVDFLVNDFPPGGRNE